MRVNFFPAEGSEVGGLGVRSFHLFVFLLENDDDVQ